MTTETRPGARPAFHVDVENGIVTRHQWTPKKEREAIWVDCINCGPQPPSLGEGQRQYQGPMEPMVLTKDTDGLRHPKALICSRCGNKAPWREVRIPKRDVDRHEACNQKCLRVRDTKSAPFCACGCRGRCHGIGTCQCKEEPCQKK
jgi:hypothetical protein